MEAQYTIRSQNTRPKTPKGGKIEPSNILRTSSALGVTTSMKQFDFGNHLSSNEPFGTVTAPSCDVSSFGGQTIR